MNKEMTGGQYLLNRIAELEGAVATLIDQKLAVEKERDALKKELEGDSPPA